METQKEFPTIKEEDLTPEQRERLLAFYKKLLQSKRETQAEIREYGNTQEYKDSIERLRKRNTERGTDSL